LTNVKYFIVYKLLYTILLAVLEQEKLTMSMSTYVVAFRPPDETFKKMKAIFDVCAEAGVDLPKEVSEFFDDSEPDPKGVEIKIPDAIEPWANDMAQGFQIDLDKLPKDVKYIRFYNEW